MTDDPPRDAHLLAALRHAPDRDVTPPEPLSAAILDHAQQALRAARPTWLEGLRTAVGKLWQPAPMAAFGTLAMATLVGVMWGTRDLPEATPSLRPGLAAAPPADSGAASGAAATATVAQGPLPAGGEREAVAVAAAPRATTPMTVPAMKAAPAANAVAAMAPPAAPAVPRQDALRETEARRGAGLAVTTPSPVVATDAVGGAPAPAPAAAATPTSAIRGDALGKSLADAPHAPARARSEVATPARGAVVSVASSPLARASGEIDAAIDSDATRVRWRVNARQLLAHDAAQRDWWSALVGGTQGRWQPAAPGSASGGESEPITLLIDGTPRGSLSFEPQALVWRDAGGVAWRAPVEAATLRGWQEVVRRW